MPEENLRDAPTEPPNGQSGIGRAPLLVPALSIAAHPMPHRVGQRVLLDALARSQAVAVSRNEPDFAGGHTQHRLPQPLLAPALSRTPMVVLTAVSGGGIRLDPGGSKNVALSGEPLRSPRELTHADLEAGATLELSESVVLVLYLADPTASNPADTLGMVGTSAGLQRVRRSIKQVADLSTSVLVRGETGTGKELVARAIHDSSHRKLKNFVSVNLGSIPKELAPAELFGAIQGAHSTAVKDRKGLFREADGGTLFLDEIGEASPEVQVALLRVLEKGEVTPVGSDKTVKVDVRVVAATDAPLEQLGEEGHFRKPLLFRLEKFQIHLPPLRKRREDIGPLVYHFARECLKGIGEADRLEPVGMSGEPWLPASLVSKLVRYDWPGNIRQLSNVLHQLVIANRGQPRLEIDQHVAALLSKPPQEVKPPPASEKKLTHYTEEEIRAALEAADGKVLTAAQHLGVPRPTLHDWLKKHPEIPQAGRMSVEELTRSFQECQGDVEAMASRLKIGRHALARRLRELGLL